VFIRGANADELFPVGAGWITYFELTTKETTPGNF